MKSTDRCFALMAAVFFIFLVLILVVFGHTPTNDTEAYIQYAEVCLQNGDLYPSAHLFKGEPFIWHPGPINMIVLSLGWFQSVVPLLLLYCLMKAISAFYIAKITNLFFSERTALVAMLLFMLYPNNWGASTTLLSETPMVCLMLLSLFMVLSRNGWWLMLTAGAVMAVANWFRPIAGIFLLALFIWFVLLQRSNIVKKWLPMMVGYGMIVVLIGSSVYLRTGHFIYQSQSFWYNMADDCYDGATPDAHFGRPLFEKGTPRYIENREKLTCFECNEIWKQRCSDWLKDHKTDYLKKLPWRFYYMYQNDIDNMTAFLSDKHHAEDNFVTLPLRHILDEWRHLSAVQWLALLSTVFYFSLMLLAAVGVCLLIRKRKWDFLLLALLIIGGGTLATILLVQGETRFKAPYMPFIFMLASITLNSNKLESHSN